MECSLKMILLYSIFYIRVDLLFQVRDEFTIPDHFYLMFIRRIPVLLIRADERCLKYFRDILEFRMIDDIGQCIKTNMSETDIFMPVFVCPPLILGILDVQYFNPADSDCLVEFFNDTIEIIYNIISPVVHVACIETYTQTIIVLDSIDNACKLFKSPAHFRTLTRHRFKGNLHILFRRKHFIKPFYDGLDSTVRPCADMAAGVQDNLFCTKMFRAYDFLLEEFNSMFKYTFAFGIRYIDDVGSVHNDI